MPLRGRDLVALGIDGHRLGLPRPCRARRELVQEMLAAVDAEHFADARVGRLSGGEQQRILIAHALISRPPLLLLDEPLANLDLRSAREVVNLLARIAREQQIAVLISAHEMNALLPVMDRVVYLADGRAACGTADEVVRSDVLSRLYGHQRRRAARARAGDRRRRRQRRRRADASAPPRPRRRDLLERRSVAAILHAIVEPGFFSSAQVQLAAAIGGVVAIVAAGVGVFTVIRGQSFAGEALGDIGAAGGSSAYLIGISAALGVSSGSRSRPRPLMELIGIQRVRGRDLATGIVLGFGFGLAALFLYLGTTHNNTTGATISILFGSIFALRRRACRWCSCSGPSPFRRSSSLYRPLLLVSVSPELAAARGIRVRLIGAAYLLAMAVAVALCGTHDRGDPVDRAAGRTGRHGAAPDQPPAPRDPGRGGDRRGLHMARNPARLGQLLLAWATAGRSASSW